jgi:hypothetical protein
MALARQLEKARYNKMKDFAVDPHSNKFLWDKKGLQFTSNHLDYMAQKVRCAISIFLGEWFLNKNIGIPYIPTTMEKINHRPILETALIVTISNIKGIKRLASFDPTYDSRKRLLKIKFVAECENGEILYMNEEIPIQRSTA